MRHALPSLALLLLACAGEPAAGRSESAIDEATAEEQKAEIVETARAAAANKRPGGRCYAAVARYIDTVGYGDMPPQSGGAIGTLPSIPREFVAFAHQFADYVNIDGNAVALGLTRLPLDDPYEAPAGAIVVVRAGTPGTHHPTAGDISVADGNGAFYNDGNMTYGGPENFPPGNDFVLGIYVPASKP